MAKILRMPLRRRCGGMDVQFAEPSPERLVLVERKVLVAEEDHHVLHPRIVDFVERPVVERPRQVDPPDFHADGRRQRVDLDNIVRHSLVPASLTKHHIPAAA